MWLVEDKYVSSSVEAVMQLREQHAVPRGGGKCGEGVSELSLQ